MERAWFADTSALRTHALARLAPGEVRELYDGALIPERGDHQLGLALSRGAVVLAGPRAVGQDARAHGPVRPEEAAHWRPAAVLVAIVERAGGLNVILTVRSEALPSHAGQIAFPGGKIDLGREDALGAALREAEEEIALPREGVEPLGYLDCYQTGSGFRIQPVVALVDPEAELMPHPREVADVFEVPLAFLMNARNHRMHSAIWRGARRNYYAMPYGERYIWGATAGILRNLHERLEGV
ncbi:MAG: CoA pyrophosphatase [Rhizobiales bacterium]|nr:CoA pyrophosphatase [Hyphomicrobiales bacterium]